MADFQTVCRIAELPEGESTTIKVGNRLIALFHYQGQFYALDDVCPHMGASLGSGFVESGTVTCPWHAWRFRLADGIWADNPRGKVGVSCYAVRVEGDQIQVQLPDPPS